MKTVMEIKSETTSLLIWFQKLKEYTIFHCNTKEQEQPDVFVGAYKTQSSF